MPSEDYCGENRESGHTLPECDNQPTWIITATEYRVCTTDFVGGGYENCQNNTEDTYSYKATYTCVDGVLSYTTEVWKTCPNSSAGMSGDPCDASDNDEDPVPGVG